MTTILILAAIFCLYQIAKGISDRHKEAARQEAENRRQADNQRMREEWRRTQAEAKVAIMKQEAMWKEQERAQRQAAKEREELRREQERVRKEQDRQRKEQERQAKEQARQAAQLERHEDMLMKLDHRLAAAESEIAFNREQRERIFSLLEIEEAERDACIKGSTAWQKHQKKVIALENQVHTVQKRIDKAQADKRFCESKLA